MPGTEEFCAKEKKLNECDHFVDEVRRIRQRNRRYDEPGSASEVQQTPADTFRTGSFLVIIDCLDAELRKRLGAYTGIASKFGFLRNLKDLPDHEVIQSAKSLHEAYPMDLEACLPDEVLKFSVFLNTEFAKKSLDATTSSSVAETDTSSGSESDHDGDIHLNEESLEIRMYKLLVSNNLETVFPNTVMAFRIYLSSIISNCSGERPFSKLKLIKSQLGTCMKQERLNNLTLLRHRKQTFAEN